MPIVTVAMYSGKTQTEKDRLAEAITEDVVRILKVPKKMLSYSSKKQPMGTGMVQAFAFEGTFLIMMLLV